MYRQPWPKTDEADLRRDPSYADGFEAAKVGEPLYDDAIPPYAAGWNAYWQLHEAARQTITDFKINK